MSILPVIACFRFYPFCSSIEFEPLSWWRADKIDRNFVCLWNCSTYHRLASPVRTVSYLVLNSCLLDVSRKWLLKATGVTFTTEHGGFRWHPSGASTLTFDPHLPTLALLIGTFEFNGGEKGCNRWRKAPSSYLTIVACLWYLPFPYYIIQGDSEIYEPMNASITWSKLDQST